MDAIDSFTKIAMVWNKNQFGNILTKKKNLMARINGIQRTISTKPSRFFLNLEEELLRELDLVLNQEEELWALKSRVNWMIQGDQNMTFYHVSTLVRRKRNQAIAIKNAVGDWIYEERDIKEFIEVVLLESIGHLMWLWLGQTLTSFDGKLDFLRWREIT